ncbi:MAG: hypothetical protein KKB51_23010 [Candidatus Riflebacteria bacterium]|nr:hypothetical protein [Candidatus Riflebacteria bacterium]
MNKIIGLMILISLVCSVQAMAFDEAKLRSVLEGYSKIVTKLATLGNNGNSGKGGDSAKGSPADDEFVWLKADKVNAELESMIRGIETAKGVATALAIIINLYESDSITVEVALASIKMLKDRAVFLKLFITNGNSELEIMIHILNEHEADFSQKAKDGSKTTVNIEATGKIKNPAPSNGKQ